MKYALVFITLTFSIFASAAEVVGEVVGVVDKSTCVIAAEEDTSSATMIGGGAGAVGGAVLGGLVGGKSGAGWGGLLGAGAGALLGSNSGKKAYRCTIVADVKGKKTLFETISGKQYRQGEQMTFIETDDGKLTPM